MLKIYLPLFRDLIKFFLNLIMISLFMFFYPTQTSAETALTLEQAIKTGLAHSPLIIAGKYTVEASTQGTRAAHGQLWPQLDSYAGYLRMSDPAVIVPIKEFGGPSPVFSRDHYSLGVTMKIPIFEGGRNWTRLSSEKISEAISREILHLTKQELVADITNIFNRVLYLEKLIISQKNTLYALQKARDDAGKRLDVGRVAPVELMRIETQVAQQEQSLVTAKEEWVRTRQLLAQFIGREPSWQPDVSGNLSLPDSTFPAAVRAAGSPDISQRPDIKKAKQEVKLADIEVKYLNGYNLPSINLVGDYGRRAGSGVNDDEEIWSGGVQMSFNLFSGGTITARVHQARARALAAKEHLRQTRLVAMTQVENAISRLQETCKRYQVAGKALSTAKETWRIEDLKYRTGAGTVTDSLLAQSSWSQAEAGTLAALYDYHTAEVEYLLAVGMIDSGFGSRTDVDIAEEK
jgi:outer membrane protein TolC